MLRLLAAFVPLLALTLGGCAKKTEGTSETITSEGQSSVAPSGTSASREGLALLRFLNADPAGKPRELGTMDGFLFSDVPYKSLTPYKEVPVSYTRFRLRETGGPDDLEVKHTELLNGIHYTLVAMPTQKGTSRLLMLRDDLDRTKFGKAEVRLINATPGADDLDLYAVATNKRIERGVDPAEATSFTNVDPGTFEIRPAKQAAPAKLANLKVDPDHLYTFVVIGKSPELDVVVINDQVKSKTPSNVSSQ